MPDSSWGDIEARVDRELAILTKGIGAAADMVSARRELKTVADQKPRSSLAMLAKVLNSTGREAEDEASALIRRRQHNHARLLALVAKGHGNEKLREAAMDESEKEAALDDLEAALGSNGCPSLEEPSNEDLNKARSDLAAAKSSSNA